MEWNSVLSVLSLRFLRRLDKGHSAARKLGRSTSGLANETASGPWFPQILLLTLVAWLPVMGGDMPCEARDLPIVDGIVERLRWTELWRPEGVYPLNSEVFLRMFIGRSIVGYCSAALDRCEEFKLLPHQGIGHSARSLRGVGLGDPPDQIEKFMKSRKTGTYEPGGTPGPVGAFKTPTGGIIEVPTASLEPPKWRSAPEEPYRTCSATISKLPAVAFPDASRRVLPESAKELAGYLGRAVRDWRRTVGQKLEYVIPFFTASDPMVFVLCRVDGRPESVTVYSNVDPGWTRIYVATGEWNKEEFDRTVKLIEKGQALVVKE